MLRKTSRACLLVSCLLLAACTSRFPITSVSQSVPMTLLPISAAGIQDKRARFREILCAVSEGRGPAMPDYRPCDQLLRRVGAEAQASGQPVQLGKSQTGLQALFVPGVAWDCFDEWLEIHQRYGNHVRQFGYGLTVLKVEGLSSSNRNAEFIQEAIINLSSASGGKKIVLIGYSKGTNDILETLVAYPKLQSYVAAVVSLSGAVGGSPLAEDADPDMLSLLTLWPGADCDQGDAGALRSLRPSVRQAWLFQNPLPKNVPYFSLVTLPVPEQISLVLKPSYHRLSQVDARNDGQLLFYDQLIPGSHLLGYLNADHLAVAVPIARSHAVVGATLADQNRFPREVLFEAILRMVEEAIDPGKK